MMVMVVVMVMVVIIVMMVVVMVMVMVMVMVVFSNYHGLFFRDGRVGGAFVLGSQNLLCIRNGIQQLGK